MHPVLFSLGPVKIYSYGLFMAIAFITSIFLIEKKAWSKGFSRPHISNLCVITFISGILGARLMYVIINFSYYRDNPVEILMLHRGGLMFHGGFILGISAFLIYARKSKLNLLPLLDIVALCLPLGQAIGRIGCLLNGCCFGKQSLVPWAVKLASEDFTRHPAQIYESMGSIIIFIILSFVNTAGFGWAKADGRIFSLYLMLYPLNRILAEEFRGDLPEILMGFSLTQWMSAGVFIAGVIIFRKAKAQ